MVKEEIEDERHAPRPEEACPPLVRRGAVTAPVNNILGMK